MLRIVWNTDITITESGLRSKTSTITVMLVAVTQLLPCEIYIHVRRACDCTRMDNQSVQSIKKTLVHPPGHNTVTGDAVSSAVSNSANMLQVLLFNTNLELENHSLEALPLIG